MQNKITIAFIRRRFELFVCPALGLKYSEKFKLEGGYASVEKKSGGRFCAVYQMEGTSGERNISESLSKAEFMAWMDGVIACAEWREKSEKALARVVADFVIDHRNGLGPDISRLSLALGSPKHRGEG